MHHEDRAGVNAFIRGVDTLARESLPAAVILCTNRLKAIDPAVRRRAADIFEFARPNDEQRRLVIEKPLKEMGFTDKEIGALVQLTGPKSDGEIGFTYSDLTQRILPALVLDAYPDKAVTHKRALEVIKAMTPTPDFIEQ
jgi:AAA+ superfamily predicted ATPase